MYIIILMLMILLPGIQGCSSAAFEGPAAETVRSTPSAEPISPSPSALSPSPTIPAQTATHTPKASPKATPAPSIKKDTVTVAEGFYYTKLTDGLKKRITGMSYPADGKAEISYDDLRYIKVRYYDFDGNVNEGELITDARLAGEVALIFHQLYEAKYPFTSIRLVDDYGEPGDDNLSMAANNTSAFNYRYVTGTKKLSLHSYGDAIDINPMMNPYIADTRIAPPNGAQYADRTKHLPGMIDHDDLCYKLFTAHGWRWGGDSSGDKDYQHFSKKQ
jgi:hypothetical protein